MSKALNGTGLGQVIDWISTRVFKRSEGVSVGTIGIDNSPTSNSGNLVTSGGVYNAVDAKYTKPASGIPASDLASGVIPDITGKEDTSNKVTSLSNSSTDTQYPSAKCVYDEVHPAVGSSQPVGGFLPNVFYALGELAGDTTFTLAAATDNTILNHYYWTFDTPSTAPTITWPTGLTWVGGSAPTVAASKHYEVSVINGIAAYLEV